MEHITRSNYNMSRKPQKKEFEDAKLNKCSVCENYIRRIEEIEQTLSGKETIITALQKQLKKCENNYKDMFNNFEKMRFEHSTALQDNFSLKEINSKLQEVTAEKKTCSKCKECPKKNIDRSLKSDNNQSRELPNHLIQPLLKEVGNIEKLVDSQNRILQELIEKIINEIKGTKTSCTGGQSVSRIEDNFKEIESGDHLNLDTHPKFRKLVAEIEGLKSLLENNQRENDRMRHFLIDKADKLTQCSKISEKGDQENCDTDMADSHHNSIISKLKNEMKEKEQHFERCTCQLIEQLNEMHANNQVLSDTLEVVTAENKNNLGIISKLKEELNGANQECEKKIDALKSQIRQLENDHEDNKDLKKKLKATIDQSETETGNLKNRLKRLIEENNKLKDCKCDAEAELKHKMAEMEIENETLKKELAEKASELTEYEEENRSYCQRLDVLTNYNGELTNKINELQQELMEKSKELDKVDRNIQSLNKIQDQVNKVNKENKCLSDKCRVDQIEIADKTFQLDCLKKSIKTQLEELEKLSLENEELRKEIDKIKEENKAEIEKWQSMVNHSQNQVDMLLKEHDEKTSQIENVANELDNIRRSVTEDNDNFMTQIRQLEAEKEELMKIAKEHEECKVCTCDGGREEIERLKAELIKKQCIIMELEKSVDSFNETMKSFDQTAESLSCENSCLKAEKDQLYKDLEDLQSKLAEKIEELDKMRKQLENAELTCGKCAKAAKTLEVENTQLKNKCQACLSRKEQLEMENGALKKELGKLREEKGQLEKTIAENYQLQMELDTLKSEHTRRESTMSGKLGNIQQAYEELKNLFDLTNAENEQLRENIRKCTQSVEEAKKNCSCLEEENQGLKKETRMMTEEVDCLRTECDKLKKHCAKKCLEVQNLKETMDEQQKEKRVYEKDCRSLRQRQAVCEKELAELKDKLNELRQSYDQKTQELKKIKKQYESCAKQSQITREEYNNLRKEYKEIKAMLSEQIKRYRLDTDSMEASQPCQVVTDLKRQLQEKENEMKTLQQKLMESSYEIIELKDYIHKLICDNNVLKSAINSLISNLERKIKGPSFGSLPSNSAEAIAGEILNSLSSIENIVKSSGDICPRGCPIKKCDCMIEITSQYSKESQQGPSDRPSTQQFAQTRSLSKTISDPLGKPASAPLPRVSGPRRDESETTDSDDPHFMDKKSLEFFKETIQELKTRMDCTMKEKCCGCEKLATSKRSK